MVSPVIETVPIPLTAEQAEAMAQRQIKKHHVAIVLLHWFNATSWLLELATGAGLIVAPAYRFAPVWYLQMMEGMFGSRANMLRFHLAVGLTWITVFLVYAIFGFRNYLHTEVLQHEVALDHDDLSWLRVRTLHLLGRSDELLPPQGAYNAGQKLFALLVYVSIPVIMLTGLIMAFHWFGTAIVAWAMVIHFLAVGMVVSGLMIHVYMGAVFPEEKPAFYSMITGMVDELYAYRYHFKWWREVKAQELLWKKQLTEDEERQHGSAENADSGAAESAPGSRALQKPEE
ncbi:MAG: cytochrome b/b6 domain-containing protein [Acidobacteriia bacterium]|nr:cytochrome b/b6 domain-containing protein [Terriglobia bacterium]